MAGNGPGGTPFESMSHEQMLTWLDQAKSGEVQAAADRLTAAAEEIRKIAGELKVRPQYVSWKGEGADAFRTWAADLANSTLRLGDFSEGAGKWLTQASGAIATAQASVPRDAKGAQANLDAARAAHNDPDSATVSTKARSELAALNADQEKVRLEAAAQMRKLGQTYELSATQMNALERPKFPPPPAEITPFGTGEQSTDLARPSTSAPRTSGLSRGGSGSGIDDSGGVTGRSAVTGAFGSSPSASRVSPHSVDQLGPRTPVNEPAARVAADSVGAVPETHQPPDGVPGAVPAPTPVSLGTPPSASGGLPPLQNRPVPVRAPSVRISPGGPAASGRLPTQPVQGPGGSVPGRGAAGAGAVPGRGLPSAGAQPVGRSVGGQGAATGRGVPTGSGITGGRSTAASGVGRPAGRLPGGTVVGGQTPSGRGPAGGTPVTGPRGQGAVPSSNGPGPGRGSSSARDGITGGRSRQTGGTPARPGAPVPTAPTRGGISGGVPSGKGGRRATEASGGPRTERRKQERDRRDESLVEER